MRKWVLLWLTSLFLAGCQSPSIVGETITVADGSYQNITAAELNVILQDKDFLLVNVHIPPGSKIPGTDFFLPYNEITIPENISQLPQAKGSKIVLYCRSGRMSEMAAEELIKLGYINVWNVSDGMLGWEQAGYRLE